MTLTVEQIRAARGLLKWTRQDLADAARVSLSTIQRLEDGRTPQAITLRGIRGVLEDAGVEFVPGGAKLRHKLAG